MLMCKSKPTAYRKVKRVLITAHDAFSYFAEPTASPSVYKASARHQRRVRPMCSA